VRLFLAVLVFLFLFFGGTVAYTVVSENKVIETFGADDSNRDIGDLNVSDGNLSLFHRDRYDVSSFEVLGYDYNACGAPYSCTNPLHNYAGYAKMDYAFAVEEGEIAWNDYNWVGRPEMLQGFSWAWTDFNFTGVTDGNQTLHISGYDNLIGGENKYGLFNFSENEWEWFFWNTSSEGDGTHRAMFDINGDYIQDGNMTLRIDTNSNGDSSNIVGIIDAWLTTNNIYDMRNVLFSSNTIVKSMTFPEVVGEVKLTADGYFPAGTDANYYVSTHGVDPGICDYPQSGGSGANPCVWHRVESGQVINFDNNQATDLRFKIELGTTNNTITPLLASITLDYNTVLFNQNTDVNILGDFNSFGFVKGGSDRNVWFAVHDADDNASELLVDFNISSEPALGSGTVVFSDLNLAVDFNHPDNVDWNFLDAGFDVNFYWLWSVPLLDANYYACVNVKDVRDDVNYGECSSLSFIIDSTEPVTKGNDFNALWQNADGNLQFSCSDSLAGCKNFYYSLDDVNYQVEWGDLNVGIYLSSDLNHKIYYWSDDLADNNELAILNFLAIDKTVPVTDNNAFNADTVWFVSDLNINFKCSDTTSGCKLFSYSINDVNYWDEWGDLNVGISVTTDGNTIIWYYSTDVADNNELGALLNIGLDKTKPTTSWNKDTNTWYTTTQTVTFTCHDSASGCDVTKYRYKSLPNGSFTSWQIYTSSVVFDTDGRYHIDFNSTDVAGNVGDKNTVFLFLDKVKPTVSSDVNNDVWNLIGDANLQMTAYDLTSGIDKNWFRIDDDNTSGINWGPWQSFDQNILVSYARYGDGNFAVQYFVSDVAGWDSNSDMNSETVFVLLDVNGPEWPTSITPTSGNYTGTVTITCSKQIWVRDINYVIDFNTDTEDWNQIYNGTSNFYTFDINYMSANTKVWFRCKHIDPDKNSGYYTSPTNIIAQADTGFESISNARPLTATTIFSSSATFSVDASDPNNTHFCTFEIYKNGFYDADYNGVPPATDNNNGTWTYTYSGLVNGDTVYSYIWCQDGQGNASAKISTDVYSVSITTKPPAGGGGGMPPEVPKIVVPSLVKIYPSTKVITLAPGIVKTYFIVLESLSDSDMLVNVEIPEELSKFMIIREREPLLHPKESVKWEWNVMIPGDMNFSTPVDANLVVDLAEGQERVPVPLRIEPTSLMLDQILSIRIFGVSLVGIVLVFLVLILVLLVLTSKKRFTWEVIR